MNRSEITAEVTVTELDTGPPSYGTISWNFFTAARLTGHVAAIAASCDDSRHCCPLYGKVRVRVLGD